MTKASQERILRRAEWATQRLMRKMIREKSERDAKALGAEECRRKLAEWAAQPGRTQAELDELNALNKMDS